LADFVHRSGFGSVLCRSKNVWMSATSALTDLWALRLSCLSVSSAKNRSTWFSHDPQRAPGGIRGTERLAPQPSHPSCVSSSRNDPPLFQRHDQQRAANPQGGWRPRHCFSARIGPGKRDSMISYASACIFRSWWDWARPKDRACMRRPCTLFSAQAFLAPMLVKPK
jgi:hypothetical protein